MENRLIFVTHEFAPKRGGIATYVEETARALANKQQPVSVWAGGAKAHSLNTYPFPIEFIGNHGSLDWPCLWRTARFLKTRRDLIENSTLCFAEPGPIFTYLYDRLLQLPRPKRLVLVLHGSEILRLAALPHRRIRFRRLLTQADTIGTVSRYTAGLLDRHFPAHGKQVVLVPGGLRSDFRNPPPRHRPADDPELRVLTVARLHPRKGLHHTLAALGRLPDTLKRRVLYQAVGPASRSRYVKNLRRLADQIGIRMEITHDDSNLQQTYADADVFAMTSENSRVSVESFGLVYLEAGACGLPIVAHETGGVGEAVRHGDSGLLVAPGDGEGMTAAFANLLESPVLRRRLGEGGKQRASEFSWTDNAQKLFAPELFDANPLRLD